MLDLLSMGLLLAGDDPSNILGQLQNFAVPLGKGPPCGISQQPQLLLLPHCTQLQL